MTSSGLTQSIRGSAHPTPWQYGVVMSLVHTRRLLGSIFVLNRSSPSPGRESVSRLSVARETWGQSKDPRRYHIEDMLILKAQSWTELTFKVHQVSERCGRRAADALEPESSRLVSGRSDVPYEKLASVISYDIILSSFSIQKCRAVAPPGSYSSTCNKH